MLPKDVADRSLYHIELAVNTGEPQAFTFQLRIAGRLRDREAHISPTSQGAVLVFVRDVTGRVARQGPITPELAWAQRRLYGLTPRELSIIVLIASGRTNKMIAAELAISPLTVHKHVANILAKMGATSRTDAGIRAIREGLIT